MLLFTILSNRKKRSADDLAKTEQGTKVLHEELDREDKERENAKAPPVPRTNSGVVPDTEDQTGISRPNISTEHQPIGGARHPSDTLDRKPQRDPLSGGSIPSNYNPATSKRIGDGPTAADAEAARIATQGRS